MSKNNWIEVKSAEDLPDDRDRIVEFKIWQKQPQREKVIRACLNSLWEGVNVLAWRPALLSTEEISKREISWYERNGKYPERIKRGRKTYLIGDESWNMGNPNKTEFVEQRMQITGVYD